MIDTHCKGKSVYIMANPEKSPADFIAAAQSVLASKDESARKQMFAAAMQAMAMLESPLDTVWRVIMSVSSEKHRSPATSST